MKDVMFGTEPVAYAGLAAIMAVIISMELAVRICIRPNWFIVVHHAFSLIVAAGLGYLGTSASFKARSLSPHACYPACLASV